MPHSFPDHIVVTAPSLDAGAEYIRRKLGVSPVAGGAHPRMGTHNRLLKLGPALYLEVIAVDPQAPRPGRRRWFGLDEPAPSSPPRLAAWVARTKDLASAVAASPLDLGRVEPMSRGDLRWRITIPPDGSLPLGGIAPLLIEWGAADHPAATLPESGCRLVRLEGCHPEVARVESLIRAIGLTGDFHAAALPRNMRPRLIAHIRTPMGLVRLDDE